MNVRPRCHNIPVKRHEINKLNGKRIEAMVSVELKMIRHMDMIQKDRVN